jgi:hypothetical protein
MYAGLTLTRFSGRLMGAHQQVDRIARRHLGELLPANTVFPNIRAILHFEGKNGPDGIKRKSPAKDEPWHFLDPLAGDHSVFTDILQVHYDNLVKELRSNNRERAAFEAAWLAHAIADGLTPAHHYPFEEKIAELRGGAANSTRTSYKKKLLFTGETRRQTFKNMLKAYGPHGLYVGHIGFEFGFSGIIKPLRFPDARPRPEDVARIQKLGYKAYFSEMAATIAKLELFEQYLKTGWNAKLARMVRQQLAPIMIRTITVTWYSAAREADV